jgi:hypothetical protein
MKKALAVLLICFINFTITSNVSGGTIEILLNILERKGYLTHEEVEEVLREVDKEMRATQGKERIRDEIIKTEKIEEEQSPKWVKHMNWHADLRIRHDSQWFDSEIPKPDRHRERIRGRFGFTYEVNEQTKLGFQLATGHTDQITTNQTLGDVFETKSIMLDLAYVRHEFFDKRLIAYAGKFKNPFNPHTWIVFDPDLRFEGIAVQIHQGIGNNPEIFLNAGAFPLDELGGDSTDPWLVGVQGGLEFRKKDIFEWTVALAHYNYLNPELVTENNYSGNTENSFKLYNPTTTFSLYMLPFYMGLTGDYVINIGTDKNNKGYLLGTRLGHKKIKEPIDWQVFATYSRLEGDATYDEFSDSDFHSGGTNNKGWTLGYRLGLGRGWEHDIKYFITEGVKGKRSDEDRVQIDFKYKF